jgi:hypothetical protein
MKIKIISEKKIKKALKSYKKAKILFNVDDLLMMFEDGSFENGLN